MCHACNMQGAVSEMANSLAKSTHNSYYSLLLISNYNPPRVVIITYIYSVIRDLCVRFSQIICTIHLYNSKTRLFCYIIRLCNFYFH